MIHILYDLKNGLNLEEVKKRQNYYGYNEVREITINPLKKFLRKLWGITPCMLEFTFILELFLEKYIEALIIFCLLFFNAIVGFLQEKKANKAVELLKEKLIINVRAKRNGRWVLIPARELVPGDVIRLRAGDFVPADISLLKGSLEVDQSSLTGESMVVEKKKGDLLYSGSIIKRGESTGIVSQTGARTLFGHTAELVQIAKPKLHIQEIISKIVKWILIIVIISLFIIIIFSLFEGINLLTLIPLITILMVAAIPVALPTMFAISLALGSLELSRKGILITRLDATEDAATMDILCIDKTGTITINKLSIVKILALPEYSERDVILYGALASQEENQDPIDLAFISMAKEKNISLLDYELKEFFPFDPSTRKTQAIIVKKKKEFIALKGAVNTIIDLSNNKLNQLENIKKEINSFNERGYRSIAVAYGTQSNNINMIGVVMLYDKIRQDTPFLIQELKNLGISVKILTGDTLPIAKEIAEELYLGTNITRIPDLKKDLSKNEKVTMIEDNVGFAEIYPEDKYLIVKSLQDYKHIVGMTGDGVNDAPALKQAEVGIAVSNATDIAKKSSSVVLTIEGLEGIVDLVKKGRMIHQRIKTWILNKIVKTFNVVIFIILAFIIFGIYIVSVLEIIILLFLTDYITLAFSTDNIRYSKKPEIWNIGEIVKIGAIIGIIIVFEGIIFLIIGNWLFGILNNIEQLQTFTFVFLIFSGNFTVLIVRERKHFWNSKPSKTLGILIMINIFITIILASIGFFGIISIPIIEILMIIGFTFLTCLLLNDSIKYILGKKLSII